MSWLGVEGHDPLVERFRTALARGRLASTFLFVGPEGVGKRMFANRLAQSLLCSKVPEAQLQPCGRCPACQQVLAGTHPDLIVVQKPADRATVPMELFVGPQERRMREGLCHAIGLTPMMGGRKIAIIDDADFVSEDAANALLKTLEEPPPRSTLILIGTSADKQLPTIRSRCQIIRFGPLPEDILARLIVEQGIAAQADEALPLARFAEGSLARAAELAQPDLWDFRQNLLRSLTEPVLDSARLATLVTSFVDAGGKEAAPRRARMRVAMRFSLDFYRGLLRQTTGAAGPEDAELQAAVAASLPRWSGQIDALDQRIENCLEGLRLVDRNAYQAALIDAWVDGLSRGK